MDQMSRAILAVQEPNKLLEMVVEVVMSVMAADNVSLMLPSIDKRLFIAHSHGLPVDCLAETIALGERVAGRVAVSRQPTLIQAELSSDPRFADVKSFRRTKSSIVYPLFLGERLVGVLNIGRISNLRPFRKQDMERATVLTSQILLALENQRLLHQLAATERLAAVGQLATGIAHEINNPLSYVLFSQGSLFERVSDLKRLASLLAQGADLTALQVWWREVGEMAFVDEIQQCLSETEEGLTRIREIASDMRTLAKSDNERFLKMDINDAIRTALRMANAELCQRASVLTRLGAGVEVSGNVGRLSQVFINLLINAAQASRRQPAVSNEIVVTSRRFGDRVIVEVSDNGPGIGPERLARIFEAFYTTKEGQNGTGLGLSISRDIVHKHGGELRVRSLVGRGATFTVDLPAAKAPTMALIESSNGSGAPTKTTARRHVLFVDDEQSMLKAYRRTFARSCDVVLAPGGKQALAILAQRCDFDLVVCDLKMPNVSGMDVYQHVCETHPNLCEAFIFVTGSIALKDVQAFLATVHNQVLEKPFDFNILRNLIETPL